MSPSPSVLHQTIVLLLTEMFAKLSRQSGGLAFCAPMDVILADDTIVQPDLLYVAKNRRDIVKERIQGAPDLVVEVLSSGTQRRDRLEKMDLYARHGVKEYWIVDPSAKLFDFLLNEDGRFVVLAPSADRYQFPRLPEVELQLGEFWNEFDQRLS